MLFAGNLWGNAKMFDQVRLTCYFYCTWIQEKGAYVQLSLSYVALQERHGRRLRSIIVGGMQDESYYLGPVEQPSKAPRETMGDVNFPLFEDRSIREDPLGLRHSFPAQAFGLKTTVDFLDTVRAYPHERFNRYWD